MALKVPSTEPRLQTVIRPSRVIVVKRNILSGFSPLSRISSSEESKLPDTPGLGLEGQPGPGSGSSSYYKLEG